MICFCCVAALLQAVQDSLETVLADLGISLLKIFFELDILSVNSQCLLFLRNILRKRSSHEVLILETVIAEQAIIRI